VSKIKYYRWVDSEVLQDEEELASVVQRYQFSIVSVLKEAHDGLVAQSLPVYPVDTALANLLPILEDGALVLYIGPTWISVVGLCEDWHSPGLTLAEEVFGSRGFSTPVDLPDYLAAMYSLATQIGATDFQVGMLANPRKSAMLRHLTSLGMTHTTSIVSRRVTNG
jgi:hypothetical protein